MLPSYLFSCNYVILYIAFVSLTPLERTVSRPDIECSGDTIPYSCSILSNSENISLTWIVTIPEQIPLSITYDTGSRLNGVEKLSTNITTSLNTIISEEYIESMITLTVLNAPNLNGSLLECKSADLDQEMEVLYINKSGKQFYRYTEVNITQ